MSDQIICHKSTYCLSIFFPCRGRRKYWVVGWRLYRLLSLLKKKVCCSISPVLSLWQLRASVCCLGKYPALLLYSTSSVFWVLSRKHMQTAGNILHSFSHEDRLALATRMFLSQEIPTAWLLPSRQTPTLFLRFDKPSGWTIFFSYSWWVSSVSDCYKNFKLLTEKWMFCSSKLSSEAKVMIKRYISVYFLNTLIFDTFSHWKSKRLF